MVTKIPRFAFEKFAGADPTLTTAMKSVGEAMAIGRNFTEALQKALRSMERKDATFHWRKDIAPTLEAGRELLERAKTPTDGRIVTVQQAVPWLVVAGTIQVLDAAIGCRRRVVGAVVAPLALASVHLATAVLVQMAY